MVTQTRLAALALAGVVAFNFPLLALASDRGVLVAYLFGAWAVLIGAAAWAVERHRRKDRPPS